MIAFFEINVKLQNRIWEIIPISENGQICSEIKTVSRHIIKSTNPNNSVYFRWKCSCGENHFNGQCEHIEMVQENLDNSEDKKFVETIKNCLWD